MTFLDESDSVMFSTAEQDDKQEFKYEQLTPNESIIGLYGRHSAF